MARNKMKPAVAPFVDAFSETPEAESHKATAADQYLENLADQCNYSVIESDAFGVRVARKVADGVISQETAEMLAAEFGFTLADSEGETDSDDALREYAGAVIALTENLAELPESEIAEFLALL